MVHANLYRRLGFYSNRAGRPIQEPHSTQKPSVTSKEMASTGVVRAQKTVWRKRPVGCQQAFPRGSTSEKVALVASKTDPRPLRVASNETPKQLWLRRARATSIVWGLGPVEVIHLLTFAINLCERLTEFQVCLRPPPQSQSVTFCCSCRVWSPGVRRG